MSPDEQDAFSAGHFTPRDVNVYPNPGLPPPSPLAGVIPGTEFEVTGGSNRGKRVKLPYPGSKGRQPFEDALDGLREVPRNGRY